MRGVYISRAETGGLLRRPMAAENDRMEPADDEDVMPTRVRYRRAPAQDSAEALYIQMSDSPSVLGIALLVSCSAGWVLMLASTASQALQHGVARLEMVLGAIVLGCGLAVLAALWWAARGRPETAIVANGELVLRRDGVPAAMRRFPAFMIRAISVLPSPRRTPGTIEAVRWCLGMVTAPEGASRTFPQDGGEERRGAPLPFAAQPRRSQSDVCGCWWPAGARRDVGKLLTCTNRSELVRVRI